MLCFMEGDSTPPGTVASRKKYALANRGPVRPEDKELAAAARKKAGGTQRLALRFEVSKQAASGWGNTRNIPRHLKKQLQAFVAGSDSTARSVQRGGSASGQGMDDDTVRLLLGIARLVLKHRDIQSFLLHVAHLSPDERRLVMEAIQRELGGE